MRASLPPAPPRARRRRTDPGDREESEEVFLAPAAWGDAPRTMEPSSSGGEKTAHDAWHRAPDGTLRREVWPRAMGLLDTTSPECMRIPGHYHALLALAGETPETAQQIEKDLPRTGATFAVQGLLKPGARRRLLPSNTLLFYAVHFTERGGCGVAHRQR